MVLKGLNLARLSLTKALTHGSAQSLVAASQSSYAAQNSPFSNLANSLSPWQAKTIIYGHGQLGFNQTVSPPNCSSTIKSPPTSSAAGQPEPLAAFLAAWNKQQTLTELDLQSDPTPRVIEWKRSSTAARATVGQRPIFDTTNIVIDEEAVIFEDDLIDEFQSRPSSSHLRAYSSSHLDHLKKATSGAAEQFDSIPGEYPRIALSRRKSSSSQTSYGGSASISETDRLSKSTVKLTPLDRERELLHFSSLGEQEQVPLVFDDLVASGHTPSTASYNALLIAAISLTKSKHEIVSKVLHVYTDMLQRRVMPDVFTFSLLLELLSTRVLDVIKQRAILEHKSNRFATPAYSSQNRTFFSPSDADEYQILCQDESLDIAIDIFDSSTPIALKGFSQSTYHLLITACAQAGKIDHMIRVYSRMELRRVAPQPFTVIEMINAFGTAGDLKSAVDTYNEYKSLAIDNNNGDLQLERNDLGVYLSLVRAYYACDRPDGAQRFLDQVFQTTDEQHPSRDSLDARAVLPYLLGAGKFEQSLVRVNQYSDACIKSSAMLTIAASAADADCEAVAVQAYKSSNVQGSTHAACSLCAMYLRASDVLTAHQYLALMDPAAFTLDALGLAEMHVSASIQSGQLEFGLQTARKIFARVRAHYKSSPSSSAAIDQAIASIDRCLKDSGCGVSLIASLEIMRMLSDNDGLLPSVARHALSVFGPDTLSVLEPFDIQLVAQVQSGLILSSPNSCTFEDESRLRFVVNLLVSCNVPLDGPISALVPLALKQCQSLHSSQD